MTYFEYHGHQLNILDTREPTVAEKGPLIVDLSPYNTIGMEELHHIAPSSITTYKINWILSQESSLFSRYVNM